MHILFIFLIIFLAIVLYNLRHGIYLAIFFMPLYLWRFSILGIPSTALEAMIYILFLVWTLDKIKILPFAKREIGGIFSFIPSFSSKQFFPLNIGIVLLFVGAIISTSISTDPKTSLGILKSWFFDPFLFFIIFINVIKTNKEIHLSLISWLSSSIVVSLISLFYLLNGEITFDGRLKAFFLSPNHLAMYLAPAFLIVIWFLFKDRSRSQELNPLFLKDGQGWLCDCILGIKKQNYFLNKISNIQYPIFLLIILIPLYFTYSYGAFLGIFAGGLYLAVANKNIFEKHKTKIYLTGLILAVSLGFIFLTSEKLEGIFNSNGRSSFHSRFIIWSAAAEIIKYNPLFGIGPGTFQEIYLSYADKFSEPYLEWAVPQPHNVFLAFYLQTGIIGIIGFILILIWFFGNSKNRMAVSEGRDEALPRLYMANGALMIYFLVHGLVDTTYWKNDLALMFWLVLGIMTVNVNRKKAKPNTIKM